MKDILYLSSFLLILSCFGILDCFDTITDNTSSITSEKEFIQLTALKKELIQCRSEIKSFQKNSITKVTLTAYSPCILETDSTPTITAFMTEVKLGGIAISRDLFWLGWVCGQKVYIEGYGVFVINDLMNKRFKNRIDIFLPSKKDAKEFGIKKNIRAVLIS